MLENKIQKQYIRKFEGRESTAHRCVRCTRIRDVAAVKNRRVAGGTQGRRRSYVTYGTGLASISERPLTLTDFVNARAATSQRMNERASRTGAVSFARSIVTPTDTGPRTRSKANIRNDTSVRVHAGSEERETERLESKKNVKERERESRGGGRLRFRGNANA